MQCVPETQVQSDLSKFDLFWLSIIVTMKTLYHKQSITNLFRYPFENLCRNASRNPVSPPFRVLFENQFHIPLRNQSGNPLKIIQISVQNSMPVWTYKVFQSIMFRQCMFCVIFKSIHLKLLLQELKIVKQKGFQGTYKTEDETKTI